MRFLIAAMMVLTSAPALADTCFPVSKFGVCADVRFLAKRLVANENSPFVLTFTSTRDENRGDQVFPAEKVTVETYMPDHGHGGPKPTVSAHPSVMDFHGEKVFFPMSGDWELRITLTSADGLAKQTVKVPLVVEDKE